MSASTTERQSRPTPRSQFENKPFSDLKNVGLQMNSRATEIAQRELADLRERNRLLELENADLRTQLSQAKSNGR